MNEHLQNIKLEPGVKISRKCNKECLQSIEKKLLFTDNAVLHPNILENTFTPR